MQTPLHVAVTADVNAATVVSILLAHHANVDAVDGEGNTSLHVAVQHGNESVVQLLVDAGADLGIENQDNLTPLALSEKLGLNGVQAILRQPRRPSDSELVAAVEAGDVATLRVLLDCRGNLNATDETGQTLLHLAIRGNAQDVFAMLLSANDIDKSKINVQGDSPLVMAIKLGHRSFAKMIFAAVHEPTLYVPMSELLNEADKPLGCGGVGTVRKASWRGRSVAIKTGSRSADAEDSLEKEIRALKTCPSPYLLQLFAVTPSPNVRLVLEYMDGGDLRQYLDKKRDNMAVPIEYSALEVAWVIANALADLHHAGLLHRDLKSSNVLLSSTNYIKVADLGLTRADASTMTKGVGTFFWMAPEVQLCGAKYGASADIYSFGVILTELDTFQAPYAELNETVTPWYVMAQVAAGKLRPNLRDYCPKWLRKLAEACMAHDPNERPSAHDIVEQLQCQLQCNDMDPLSTRSLLAPTINCTNCGTPQPFLSCRCSVCAIPAESVARKFEDLRARIAVAKDRGVAIDTTVPCFACSAPNDVAADTCSECNYVANDEDRLRIFVAIVQYAQGSKKPAVLRRLPSLMTTDMVCPVCKVSHLVTDAKCSTCSTPAPPAAAKLEALLWRIAVPQPAIAIDVTYPCSVCETPAQLKDVVCFVCEEELASDEVKVEDLCRRIESIAKLPQVA
ncbi:protein kinase [Achlya hypogyna]|uniref:Protein kinase n=1 Tax=Achlya hypogyna TaxID=1202772 RepID=A0A1V9ZMX1_ACHHY|nr:protein kinase [Achlya hypogyna]